MSFNVIEPISIAPAQVVQHSVTAMDPSPAWTAGQTWTEGALCHRPTTLRVYRRITAGTDTVPPEEAPKVWQSLRACNQYAAFNYTENTPTAQADGLPLRIVLQPGRRVDTVGLYGLQGARATITARVAGQVIYGPKAEALQMRDVRGWYDFFTASFLQRGAMVFVQLPPFSGAEIEIVIEPVSGAASVQYIVLGRSEFLGRMEWRPSIVGNNFSRIEREFDGSLRPGVSLVRQRTVPGFSGSFIVPASNVDRLRRIRDRLNAVPALWAGLATSPGSNYYESVLLFGLYRRLEYTPDNLTFASAAIEIEEL